jgi:hypothetical protein
VTQREGQSGGCTKPAGNNIIRGEKRELCASSETWVTFDSVCLSFDGVDLSFDAVARVRCVCYSPRLGGYWGSTKTKMGKELEFVEEADGEVAQELVNYSSCHLFRANHVSENIRLRDTRRSLPSIKGKGPFFCSLTGSQALL